MVLLQASSTSQLEDKLVEAAEHGFIPTSNMFECNNKLMVEASKLVNENPFEDIAAIEAHPNSYQNDLNELLNDGYIVLTNRLVFKKKIVVVLVKQAPQPEVEEGKDEGTGNEKDAALKVVKDKEQASV